MDEDLVFTPVTMHGSQAGMKTRDKGGYAVLKYTPALPEGLSSAGHTLRKHIRYTPVWSRNNIDSKAVYTPSITGIENRGRIEKEKLSFTLDWWTKSAMYNYDALMISTFYGLDKWNFREYYKIPRKNFLLVADSGGYQISTQKVQIEPERVLKWMEDNVDVGMTLDAPPLDMSLKVVGSFENFKRGARKSKRNYDIMYRSWNGKLDLLKVIHGSKPKWIKYWYDQMKDFEFSGLAFSPKPLTVESVAINLAFAKHVGAKKVHIFLGTGADISPLTIYAKKFFDRLTFDSSSFSIAGARYRSYYLPYKFSKTIEFGGKYKGNFKHLPCTCPVCQFATVKDMNDEGSLPGGLIALHNLYVYLQYFYFLKCLSDDKETYVSFLKTQELDNVIRMIDFLDLSADIGFYDAYDKFFKKEKVNSYGDFFGDN
jgi:hypothetical protein